MSEYKIESDWITKSGLRAIVINGDVSRCGYVGIDKTHPLYGVWYDDQSFEILKRDKDYREDMSHKELFPIVFKNNWDFTRFTPNRTFKVHGGITFADFKKDVSESLWWFGYDCSHSGDKCKYWICGEERTLEYCMAECESLAQQLVDFTKGE